MFSDILFVFDIIINNLKDTPASSDLMKVKSELILSKNDENHSIDELLSIRHKYDDFNITLYSQQANLRCLTTQLQLLIDRLLLTNENLPTFDDCLNCCLDILNDLI